MDITINNKDREILCALSLNGRISVSKLARQVNLSKQVVSYRLRMMEDKQVIRRYYSITNIYELGKIHYRVFIKYRDMNSAAEKELCDYLVQHLEVAWVLLLDGDFDLFFVVWADDIVQFERVYDEIMGRFGAYFGEKYFSIATRIEYLPYRFISPKDDELCRFRSVVCGGGMAHHRLDELEKKVLLALNHEGRINYTELAKTCGASQQVVKNKIKSLEERGILIGYNVKIDHSLLGYTYRKVLLKLNDTSRSPLEELSTYLRERVSVIYLLKTIGTYDFEFELMTRTGEEFYGLLRELRQDFAGNIREYSVVTMNDEPKYEHLAL